MARMSKSKRNAIKYKAIQYLISKGVKPTRRNVEEAVRVAAMEVNPSSVGNFGGVVMNSVSSSHLTNVGYDMNKKILYVAFKNGSIYTYNGISDDVYLDIVTAPSPGSTFHQLVRGSYTYSTKAYL